MKHLFTISILLIISLCLSAQDFEVPQNYVLNEKEDYSKYEPYVLEGIDWLLNTPINVEPDKREEVNTFLMKWMIGSPTVTIVVKQEIVSFLPNADLLMVFLCGWTKYAIENEDYKNEVMGNQKGIEAVIDFYISNKEYLKKDKNVEKYIKLQRKGKLEAFIKENV